MTEITDGRNRYAPCPCCGATLGMGLTTRRGRLAVECCECAFRGPEVEGPPSNAKDRAAFEGWNEMPRIPNRSANIKNVDGK